MAYMKPHTRTQKEIYLKLFSHSLVVMKGGIYMFQWMSYFSRPYIVSQTKSNGKFFSSVRSDKVLWIELNV